MKSLLMTMCLCALLFACKKEGCIDAVATNFDSEANKDDASCSYDASITFWYSSNTSGGMVFNGATNLSFYLDNQLIGTKDPYIYWDNPPACLSTGSLSITKSLGSEKEKSFSWKVEDQSSQILYSGTWNAMGGECAILEVN